MVRKPAKGVHGSPCTMWCLTCTLDRVSDTRMDLADFMKNAEMTDAKLAELVGRDRSNVTRWRRKQTKPDFYALVAIEKITDGKVTASDFVPGEAAE